MGLALGVAPRGEGLRADADGAQRPAEEPDDDERRKESGLPVRRLRAGSREKKATSTSFTMLCETIATTVGAASRMIARYGASTLEKGRAVVVAMLEGPARPRAREPATDR